ncbi:UshA-like (seleno)protein [Candidatus Electronema sp. JM]|uniref:UshA-like (seleno)protein n=1 Tax=Candidatus Electronema sp. JM TaxID=3401571 RepID=UPI003AA94894
MLNKKLLPMLLCLLLSGLLAAPLRAADFLLFYSNDGHGETEPCGCRARQLGGLARQALQLSQITAKEQRPALFLSGGGLLFRQTSVQEEQKRQELINAEGIAEAMRAMDCRALGLEAHDLAGGIALLKQWQEKHQLAWLSMNLVDAKKKQPVFAPYLLTELAGIQIAVLGLTGSLDAAPDKADYLLLPWKEALSKTLAQVSGKADMIILLSSYPYEVNKEIAEANPGVHLLLASGPGATGNNPFMVGSTLFAQTGARGKTLGMMRVAWTEAGRWEDSDLTKIRLEQSKLDQLNAQLGKLKPEDKERQRLLAEKQQIEKNIKLLREKKKPEGEAPNLCRFSNDFIELDAALPEDQKVRGILDQAKQRLADLNQERAAAAERAVVMNTLAGWERCAVCHPAQAEFWQKTRHAASLQPLEKKKQQLNEDCLLCHVTLPYYEADKVKAEKLLLQVAEQHRRVSCESCHGPAAAHAAKPNEIPAPRPKPAAPVCLGCHTPEHDGNFVFADKVEKVRCPAGSTTERQR